MRMIATVMLAALAVTICIAPVHAENVPRLTCLVAGSEDVFELYPEQLAYEGKHFWHFQVIDGLTVVVVHQPSLQFNRLSNLNLLPNSTLDPSREPEAEQFFTGQCQHSAG